MNKRYHIRVASVFLFFCSLYLIILSSLYVIQIKQREFFINLGHQQYHVTTKTIPSRALIYDRNKQALAMNKDSIAAFVMPKKIEQPEKLEPFLKKYFPQALERLYNNRQGNFLYLKRKLSSDQLKLIKQYNLADIHLLKEPNRFYPLEATGPIVGITNVDNKGLFGIELVHEKQLAGTPATVSLEKDARSGFFYFKKDT